MLLVVGHTKMALVVGSCGMGVGMSREHTHIHSADLIASYVHVL